MLLNNSDTPFIRELYGRVSPVVSQVEPNPPLRPFDIKAVPALRAINSDPTKRKGATELVITNYA